MLISDMTDVRILVELARGYSFAEAGRRIGLPAATLSRRVARMEGDAGLRLFERSTRHVTITEAGRIAIDHATQIFNEAKAVDHSLEAMRGVPAGRVRVTAPIILGQTLMGPIAAQYIAKFPLCDLTLTLENRRVDLFEENYDVAIRVGDPGLGDLTKRTVGEVESALYRGVRKSDHRPLSIDDLEGLPVGLLRSDDLSESMLTLSAPGRKARKIPIRPRLVSLSPPILLEAALQSDLVVMLPRMNVRKELENGRLERVCAPWVTHNAPVNILFKSRHLMRPAIRSFIDFVTEPLMTALVESGEDVISQGARQP